jgi:hypothetical protein
LDQAQEKQQHDGTKRGKNQTSQKSTRANANQAKNEPAQESTDNANHDVPQKAEATPPHNGSSYPARNGTDDNPENYAGKIHGTIPPLQNDRANIDAAIIR